jgi:hypothetical protein
LMTTIKLECSMIPLFYWWKQDIITHDKQATRDFFDVTRMQWASKRQLVCNKWMWSLQLWKWWKHAGQLSSSKFFLCKIFWRIQIWSLLIPAHTTQCNTTKAMTASIK